MAATSSNLPNLSTKFRRLGAIFENCEVKAVVTLRHPLDYLYSCYVTVYPKLFGLVRELDTDDKFAQAVINDPKNLYFESFFYEVWLRDLRAHFDTHVLRFEDFEDDPMKIYGELAPSLNIAEVQVNRSTSEPRLNVKDKPESGEFLVFRN